MSHVRWTTWRHDDTLTSINAEQTNQLSFTHVKLIWLAIWVLGILIEQRPLRCLKASKQEQCSQVWCAMTWFDCSEFQDQQWHMTDYKRLGWLPFIPLVQNQTRLLQQTKADYSRLTLHLSSQPLNTIPAKSVWNKTMKQNIRISYGNVFLFVSATKFAEHADKKNFHYRSDAEHFDRN